MAVALEVAGVLAGGAGALLAGTAAVVGWDRRPAAVRSRAALHRRLRNAVRDLRATVPAPRRRIEPSMLQELAGAIEELAAQTDRSLLTTTALRGSERSRRLRAAAAEVARVEDLADRLRAVATELDPAALDDDRWRHRAARIDATLANFELAGDELRSLEADWPEDLLRRKATR